MSDDEIVTELLSMAPKGNPIHVFGAGDNTPDEAFHGRSVNCDSPEAKDAQVVFHANTVIRVELGSDDRPGGYCPKCGKNYAARRHTFDGVQS